MTNMLVINCYTPIGSSLTLLKATNLLANMYMGQLSLIDFPSNNTRALHFHLFSLSLSSRNSRIRFADRGRGMASTYSDHACTSKECVLTIPLTNRLEYWWRLHAGFYPWYNTMVIPNLILRGAEYRALVWTASGIPVLVCKWTAVILVQIISIPL